MTTTWRDIRLEDLELSIRAQNCMHNEGIETLGQLCSLKWTRQALLRLPNFGRKGLLELQETLATYGLTIGSDQQTFDHDHGHGHVPRKILSVHATWDDLYVLDEDRCIWCFRRAPPRWVLLPSLPPKDQGA